MERKSFARNLVFILTLALIVSNVEVSQLLNVTVLAQCNYSKPIPDIVFLQIFLCQILQIFEYNPLFKISNRDAKQNSTSLK